MSITSSSLLAKLENVNWCYSINTMLQGVDTNLLVKYLIQDNAYAIMLSDFSTTYFECLMGDQIDQHYLRFNKTKLNHDQVITYIHSLLQNLRNTQLKFEKIQVDCHTNRITIRSAKVFQFFKFNWNFYIISTDQDIFMKHFSVPLYRGLIHYYTLSNNMTNDQPIDNVTSGDEVMVSNNNPNNLATQNVFCLLNNDSVLKDFFRFN